MRKLTTRGLTVAGLALLGLVTAVPSASAAPAEADATPGVMKICALGGHGAYAERPYWGVTGTALPGGCVTANWSGDTNIQVDIYETNADGTGGALIGSTIYNGSAGLTINTIDDRFYSA